MTEFTVIPAKRSASRNPAALATTTCLFPEEPALILVGMI
jgi:hypothetical protein